MKGRPLSKAAALPAGLLQRVGRLAGQNVPHRQAGGWLHYELPLPAAHLLPRFSLPAGVPGSLLWSHSHAAA